MRQQPLVYTTRGFQEAVKFEDALGRVLPVPSEYKSWGMRSLMFPAHETPTLRRKIDAIILGQFKAGPGHDKVSCGEYELFDSTDARKPLSDPELGMLIPDMSIIMAFVIGPYEQQPLKMCPRSDTRV